MLPTRPPWQIEFKLLSGEGKGRGCMNFIMRCIPHVGNIKSKCKLFDRFLSRWTKLGYSWGITNTLALSGVTRSVAVLNTEQYSTGSKIQSLDNWSYTDVWTSVCYNSLLTMLDTL